MTAATHDDVPIVLAGDGLEVRTGPIGGGMSVGYLRLPEGTDMGPALKGLDGDAVPVPALGLGAAGFCLSTSVFWRV
jgi:hypothetical protein